MFVNRSGHIFRCGTWSNGFMVGPGRARLMLGLSDPGGFFPTFMIPGFNDSIPR